MKLEHLLYSSLFSIQRPYFVLLFCLSSKVDVDCLLVELGAENVVIIIVIMTLKILVMMTNYWYVFINDKYKFSIYLVSFCIPVFLDFVEKCNNRIYGKELVHDELESDNSDVIGIIKKVY